MTFVAGFFFLIFILGFVLNVKDEWDEEFD